MKITLNDGANITLTKLPKIATIELFVPTEGLNHLHPRIRITISVGDLDKFFSKDMWPSTLTNLTGRGSLTISLSDEVVFLDIDRGFHAIEQYSCSVVDWPDSFDSLT